MIKLSGAKGDLSRRGLGAGLKHISRKISKNPKISILGFLLKKPEIKPQSEAS